MVSLLRATGKGRREAASFFRSPRRRPRLGRARCAPLLVGTERGSDSASGFGPVVRLVRLVRLGCSTVIAGCLARARARLPKPGVARPPRRARARARACACFLVRMCVWCLCERGCIGGCAAWRRRTADRRIRLRGGLGRAEPTRVAAGLAARSRLRGDDPRRPGPVARWKGEEKKLERGEGGREGMGGREGEREGGRDSDRGREGGRELGREDWREEGR